MPGSTNSYKQYMMISQLRSLLENVPVRCEEIAQHMEEIGDPLDPTWFHFVYIDGLPDEYDNVKREIRKPRDTSTELMKTLRAQAVHRPGQQMAVLQSFRQWGHHTDEVQLSSL